MTDAHEFARLKAIPWPICRRCGLVWLRNPISDWAVRHGCGHADRPDYRAVLARLTVRP